MTSRNNISMGIKLLLLLLLLAAAPHVQHVTLALSKTTAHPLWQRAMDLHREKKWDQALVDLQQLELLTGNDTDALLHSALGYGYHNRDEFELALHHYQNALVMDPHQLITQINLGKLFYDTQQFRDALAAFHRALDIDPSAIARVAHFMALCYHHTRQFGAAEQFYHKVPESARGAHFHFDFGVTLERLGKLIDANFQYNEALRNDQNESRAWHNVAALHHQHGDAQDSLRNYKRVLSIESTSPALRLMATTNLGIAYEQLHDVGNALLWYSRAVPLVEEDDVSSKVSLLVHIFRAKRTACLWKDVEHHRAVLLEQIFHERRLPGDVPTLTPFDTLLTPMDPLLRLAIASDHGRAIAFKAKAYMQDQASSSTSSSNDDNATRLAATCTDSEQKKQKNKLRVGYISYDFADHPTAHLMEGLFATHDRSSFEISALGYGRDDSSGFRKRLVQLVGDFVNLAEASIEKSIQAIRARGVDILMDAQGHTRGGRPMITATRPAPIVVNYLVFPGTSGAPYVDYMVADRHVTPPESLTAHFSEKLALLPFSYQVNYYPDQVVEGGRSSLWTNDTSEHGDGDDWFTFINFNKIDKLDPSAFALWMAIMRRVPQSRLLLLDPANRADPASKSPSSRPSTSTSFEIVCNLKAEAAAQGVASDRIRFVPRVPKQEHLKRQSISTGALFLDTFVYGAHSTATDALFAGLPVLTLAGDSFASRVGVSLLANVDLLELVTHSQKEFEELAVVIATQKKPLLARLRDRLRHGEPQLFRTRDHVATLEEAQRVMATLHRRQQPTLRTAHIVVI